LDIVCEVPISNLLSGDYLDISLLNLYLCIDSRLSFILSIACLQVRAILILWIELVAILALDCQSIVDEVLELLQSGDSLL
jgi:hypothetical protein